MVPEGIMEETAMTEHKPLYRYSATDAQRNGELELWRESHKENRKCASAIEEAIRKAFDGWYLQDDCAVKVIEQYGFERVNFVLANTIREKSWDGRFSPANKDWSHTIYVPKNDHNDAFLVESHPAVLDGFVDLARQAWHELGLYDHSHCIDGEPADFTGKVLAVSPHWLKDQYKKPEYQLFYAESGFGCSPKASGRKVFGQFLYDGEQTNLDRSDFIGILKEEHLPDWAREKLDEIQGESQASAMEQTM